MKEICIINYSSNAAVYGIGTFIREYVYCLVSLGCKVTLVELGTDKKNSGFYIKNDAGDSVRTIHIPFLQNTTMDKYNKGVCRILRLYIEDAVNLVFHFQYSHSSGLLDGIKEYFPLSKSIFTIHYLYWSTLFQGNVALFEKVIRNPGHKDYAKKYGHLFERFEKEKTLLGKMDRIVCLSDDTLRLVENLYGITENRWLIPNGLRKKQRGLSEIQKQGLRGKYHIGKDEKILLFVGRIDPIKGIEPLLSGFDDIVCSYPNCRLVMVGTGDINEIVQKCKNARSKILFEGRLAQKELYQWYQIADIALFPSYYEECSYVGIEMMMNGLPIVASDGFSVRNMFRDKENAKVAKIEKWENNKIFGQNLKYAILEALQADLSGLRKSAKKTYETKYRIENMMTGYAGLFNSL